MFCICDVEILKKVEYWISDIDNIELNVFKF